VNPGATEEAGKVAVTFMDIMRTQPLALALAVMNVCLLGLFWYIADKASDTRREEFTQLLQAQKEVNELLARCVVPHGG